MLHVHPCTSGNIGTEHAHWIWRRACPGRIRCQYPIPAARPSGVTLLQVFRVLAVFQIPYFFLLVLTAAALTKCILLYALCIELGHTRLFRDENGREQARLCSMCRKSWKHSYLLQCYERPTY